MAAGVRAEEPLAELSHYVVARPIYNEAGFQEENERLPPPPPTLLERARAVCRWVGGWGRAAAPRRSAAGSRGSLGGRGGTATEQRGAAGVRLHGSASLRAKACGRSHTHGASRR